MRREYDARRGAYLGELLDRKYVAQLVDAAAAQFLGYGQAHHAHLGHLCDGLKREALRLIKLLGKGLDLVFRKVAEGLLELDMLV